MFADTKLGWTGVAMAVAVSVACALPAQAQTQTQFPKIQWKMQSAFASSLPHLGPSGVRFSKDIERMSGDDERRVPRHVSLRRPAGGGLDPVHLVPRHQSLAAEAGRFPRVGRCSGSVEPVRSLRA